MLNEAALLIDALPLRTTSAENLRRAHGLIGSGQTIGKTVFEGF